MNYTDILIELRATLRDLDLKLSIKNIEVEAARRAALQKVIYFFECLGEGNKPPLSISPENLDKIVVLQRARANHYHTQFVTRLISAETLAEKTDIWASIMRCIAPVVVNDVCRNQINLF
jgi:hypothetical protein